MKYPLLNLSINKLNEMSPTQMLDHHNQNCDNSDKKSSLKFLLALYHPDKIDAKEAGAPSDNETHEEKSKIIIAKYKNMMERGSESSNEVEIEFIDDAINGLRGVLSAFLSAYRGEFSLHQEVSESQKDVQKTTHRLLDTLFTYEKNSRRILLNNLNYEEATAIIAIIAIFESLSSIILNKDATDLVKKDRFNIIQPKKSELFKGNGVNSLVYYLDTRLVSLMVEMLANQEKLETLKEQMKIFASVQKYLNGLGVQLTLEVGENGQLQLRSNFYVSGPFPGSPVLDKLNDLALQAQVSPSFLGIHTKVLELDFDKCSKIYNVKKSVINATILESYFNRAIENNDVNQVRAILNTVDKNGNFYSDTNFHQKIMHALNSVQLERETPEQVRERGGAYADFNIAHGTKDKLLKLLLEEGTSDKITTENKYQLTEEHLMDYFDSVLLRKKFEEFDVLWSYTETLDEKNVALLYKKLINYIISEASHQDKCQKYLNILAKLNQKFNVQIQDEEKFTWSAGFGCTPQIQTQKEILINKEFIKENPNKKSTKPESSGSQECSGSTGASNIDKKIDEFVAELIDIDNKQTLVTNFCIKIKNFDIDTLQKLFTDMQSIQEGKKITNKEEGEITFNATSKLNKISQKIREERFISFGHKGNTKSWQFVMHSIKSEILAKLMTEISKKVPLKSLEKQWTLAYEQMKLHTGRTPLTTWGKTESQVIYENYDKYMKEPTGLNFTFER